MNNLSKSTILTEKHKFVENELFSVLKAANKDIANCKYIKIDTLELVEITMENCCKYQIDVTADSLMAMILDVVKFMAYK